MGDLLLEVLSVADMDLQRAAAIGRAFDADPELRPLRVGGDPARLPVEPSLEALILRNGLPVDWLTVRTNAGLEAFEGGEIMLRPGRGGYSGWKDDGEWRYVLSPHFVSANYLQSWIEGAPDRPERIAALFERLCEAMDACYGTTLLLPREDTAAPIDVALGKPGWLSFYGPAFVERWPGLADTGLPTRRLANGGVLLRLGERPWEPDEAAGRPIVETVGPEAFVRDFERRGVRVPSYQDHMRFSPGTVGMPWEAAAVAKASRAPETRERRFEAARRRRERADAGRAEPPPVSTEGEWSTSLDAADWRSLGGRAFRRLGGELAGAYGRALLDEIAAAPAGTEGSVRVATDLGAVAVQWFTSDSDTIDISFTGPAEVRALIDAVYERWTRE